MGSHASCALTFLNGGVKILPLRQAVRFSHVLVGEVLADALTTGE